LCSLKNRYFRCDRQTSLPYLGISRVQFQISGGGTGENSRFSAPEWNVEAGIFARGFRPGPVAGWRDLYSLRQEIPQAGGPPVGPRVPIFPLIRWSDPQQ